MRFSNLDVPKELTGKKNFKVYGIDMKTMNSVIRAALLSLTFAAQSFGLPAQEPATITNNIGMEFVLIHPGEMVVGKFQPAVRKPTDFGAGEKVLPDSSYSLAKKMAQSDAMPGFSIIINHTYYIGKFEVTQEQWTKVMKSNPSFFKADKVLDDASKHPVENISWKDAQRFVKKLNAMDQNYRYRLPSEFEWEYAARAGAKDDISWSQINLMAVISSATTSAVGQKKPNNWGLYDTLGNVWEWVQDRYNEKIFADPVLLTKGKEHVLKGASFNGDVKNATYMTHAGGPGNGFDVGLRLVIDRKK